jgi:hypothetical protein
MVENPRLPRKAIARGANCRILSSNSDRAALNSSADTSAARLVGRRTTADIPQRCSSRRRSSFGWSGVSVNPARCRTRQNRFDGFEKLWPAAAALAAGFRPQKTTSRPLARMSDSYLVKEIRYSLVAAACPVVMCGVVPKAARELLAPSSFEPLESKAPKPRRPTPTRSVLWARRASSPSALSRARISLIVMPTIIRETLSEPTVRARFH